MLLRFLKAHFLALTLVFAFPFFAEAVAFIPETPMMKIGEVRPGMRGEAHTVIKGQAVVTFPVTVVSVLPRKGIPKHLILIRAEGPIIEKTGGIAAGMSGSPVFINGKIVGAIGYGWNFSDHRLGLVTPLEDMIAVFDWKDVKPAFYKPPLPEPSTVSPDVSSSDISSGDIPSADAEPLVTLFADGMSQRAIAGLSSAFNGKILAMGSGMAENLPPVETVRKMNPGEAVGVMLAWGDVSLGATGTLTAVSKDGRFLAFAHPFINNGAVAYPLTRAWVHDVVPSIESPFKLGTPMSIIGTVTQDRPQAIGGKLNVYPPSFDFTVNLDDVDNKKKIRKRFHVAAAPFLLSKLAPDALTGLLDDL